MQRHKTVGYIRNQTVHCDYVVCSKVASLDEVKTNKIETEEIISPVITSLLSRVTELESKMASQEAATDAITAPYVAGEIVSSTFHFDDVNLTDPNLDIEAFQNELRETLAHEAGVPVEQIIIVDLAQTGSVTARIDIKYMDLVDPVANEAQQTLKKSFVSLLNNPEELGSTLSSMGAVQLEEMETGGDILSVQSRLYSLEDRLSRDAEFKNSIKIDDYKMEVINESLKITRYDHESGQYVGGNILIDN